MAEGNLSILRVLKVPVTPKQRAALRACADLRLLKRAQRSAVHSGNAAAVLEALEE